MLKQLGMWLQNFIWLGDINNRKMVTMAWCKLSTPVDEGGLGLRSLKSINQVALLKQAWGMLASNYQWAVLMRARCLWSGKPKTTYMCSSIYLGVCSCEKIVIENSNWQLGDGNLISFWQIHGLANPFLIFYIFPSISVSFLRRMWLTSFSNPHGEFLVL